MTPECIFKPSIFLSALHYFIQPLNWCLLVGTFRVRQNASELTFLLGLFVFYCCHWKHDLSSCSNWNLERHSCHLLPLLLQQPLARRLTHCEVQWPAYPAPQQPHQLHCPASPLPLSAETVASLGLSPEILSSRFPASTILSAKSSPQCGSDCLLKTQTEYFLTPV